MRKKVVVRGPEAPAVVNEPAAATSSIVINGKVYKPGDPKLKVVTIKNGKIVKREDWNGKNHLSDAKDKKCKDSSHGGGHCC
jgi:exopolysaccharide biosynthesis protein